MLALAWAVTVGGVLQLVYQLPHLKKIGMLVLPRVNFRDAGGDARRQANGAGDTRGFRQPDFTDHQYHIRLVSGLRLGFMDDTMPTV